MGSLASKRVDFTTKFILLLAHARYLGYEPAIGEVKRHEVDEDIGHPNSVHFNGLAGHVIIYDRNFNWLSGEEARPAYEALHDYWDYLGGAPRINGDLNHFSVEHNGVR